MTVLVRHRRLPLLEYRLMICSGQSVSLLSWTIVEPGMYLIAVCLPGLRPFFSQMVPKAIISRLTKASHSSSGHHNTGPENDKKTQRGFRKLDAPFERAYYGDEEASLTRPIELQPAAVKSSQDYTSV